MHLLEIKDGDIKKDTMNGIDYMVKLRFMIKEVGHLGVADCNGNIIKNAVKGRKIDV